MDVETIEQNYRQLESQSQQTIQALTALAQKLQLAAQAGDQNAREWMLDLREIALGIKEEQNQVSGLLQAIHGFAATQLQVPSPPASSQMPYQQMPYQQQVPPPQYPQPGYPGGGGMLQRFLGGGVGRAIATGAGFGIGDDLINHLFG
ncbi:MAG: hypothetical protein JO115_13830 [Pseudonocardiales bacterium]|nr:hypothetical protein [Pseudonocardiales bacterium]